MKCIVVLFFSVVAFSLVAQNDSLSKKGYFLSPMIETGITISNNDYLKEAYNNNSNFNFSVGMRLLEPAKSKVMPAIGYSYSKYTYSTKHTGPENNFDTTFTRSLVDLGFEFVLSELKSGYVVASSSFTTGAVKDDVLNNYGTAYGFKIGLYYDLAIKRSVLGIGYSFQYLKKEGGVFRDYDFHKIAVRFIL